MSSAELDHHQAMPISAGTQKRTGLGQPNARIAAYALDVLIILGWAGFLVFVIFDLGPQMVSETL